MATTKPRKQKLYIDGKLVTNWETIHFPVDNRAIKEKIFRPIVDVKIYFDDGSSDYYYRHQVNLVIEK